MSEREIERRKEIEREKERLNRQKDSQTERDQLPAGEEGRVVNVRDYIAFAQPAPVSRGPADQPRYN